MTKMPDGLTEEQVDHFGRDGFLIIDRLVGPDAVETLRAAYDEVLSGTAPAAGDRMLGAITRQVMAPGEAHPVFRDNDALDAGTRIAEQLFEEPVGVMFSMLIYKPAGHPYETPWHQDMAYAVEPVTPAGTQIPPITLQFWVAIDDTDEWNGCMHFVAGTHRDPLLAHVVASGDPADQSRLLALEDPATQLDLTSVVAAPLAAGGCTIHAYGTPHYTPPNRSALPRRAYIFNVAVRRVLDLLE